MLNTYKPIPEFPNYEINSSGVIRNVKTGKIKSQYPANGGYYFVTLHKENRNGKPRRVHRLLAEAFIPNPDGKPCINHKNGDRGDYSLDNLEWCTHDENMKHAFATGLANNTGEKNGQSKITREIAKEIKRLLSESSLSQQRIADSFGISRSLVLGIKLGRLWRHA